MFDMVSFLAKANVFVTAAETAAVDASEKAEAVLRGAADWIAATRQNLVPKTAGPEHETACRELVARCHSCCPDCDPAVQKQKAVHGDHDPKGFGLPGNPVLTFVMQFLVQWLSQQIVTPPAPKPAA